MAWISLLVWGIFSGYLNTPVHSVPSYTFWYSPLFLFPSLCRWVGETVWFVFLCFRLLLVSLLFLVLLLLFFFFLWISKTLSPFFSLDYGLLVIYLLLLIFFKSWNGIDTQRQFPFYHLSLESNHTGYKIRCFYFFSFVCMCVCAHVCHTHRPEESVGCPGASCGVGDCTHRCWDPN